MRHTSSYFIIALWAAFVLPAVHPNLILTTSTSLRWGQWRQWAVCPPGTFVTAADTFTYTSKKTFNVLHKDDMGLIHVVLECNDPRERLPSTFISTLLPGVTSSVNLNSGPDWSTPNVTLTEVGNDHGIDRVHITFGYPLRMNCGQVMTGFAINFEEEKRNADNRALDNLRIYCSELRQSKPSYLEGYGDNQGQWLDAARCGQKQAVCGVQAMSNDLDQKESDYIGLNNIRFKCCDVPNPATVCQPTDTLELIQECSNPDGTEQFTCHFKRQVGVGTSSSKDPSLLSAYEFNQNIGYPSPSVDGSVDLGGTELDDGGEDQAISEDFMGYSQDYFWLTSGLAANFAQNLGTSYVTEYDWGRQDVNIWNAETSESVKFVVGLAYRTEIYQVVGHCSYFSVRTPSFTRRDVPI